MKALAEINEERIGVMGETIVFNRHLVHPKMLGIFEHMLGMEKDNNLLAIFISETGPMDRYAEFCKHTKSMVISLPYIMERTLKTVDEKDVGLSITAGIWINMLHVFLHELHHNVAFAVDWTATEANLEGEEEDAQEYADIMLEEAIAKFGAEVPPLAEIPWFNTHVMEFLIDEIREGEKDWAGKHKRMIDENLIFDNGEAKYTSIREYFKDSTERPDLYQEHVEVVPLEMNVVDEKEEKKEVNTNLFDRMLLPGGQMSLFSAEPVEEPASEAIIDVTPTPVETPTKEESMTAEDLEMLDMTEQLGADAEGGEVVGDINPFTGGTFPGGRNAEQYYTETAQETANALNTPVEAHFKKADGSVGHSTHYPTSGQGSKQVINPFGGEAKPVMTETPTPTRVPDTTGKLEMLRGIYMRLYEHMFAVCGFSQGAFLEPTNIVKTGVLLTEDERKSGLIVGSLTLNPAGQAIWEDVARIGGIRGRLFKNGALPGFDLIINWNGKTRKIRLLAQNPNKPSEWGMRARAGEKIAWLIDNDVNKLDTDVAGDRKPNAFVARIVNGEYTLCAR